MRLVVTCGTTPFRSLVDKLFDLPDINNIFEHIVIQEINLKDNSHSHFELIDFYSNEYDFFSKSDFIITHAGAGTVFYLLENKFKFLVVPNLDRVDKHQVELAKFIERNNYAEVCYDIDSIMSHISICLNSSYSEYSNDCFKAECFYNDFLLG